MSSINKAAVLNTFSDLTANILNYVPRATTSEFGIVAIGSGVNVDALGRIYLDTQEYSDRLAAIEAQAASSLNTQQTEVAAAIAQVNLAQSQTITALTLEVNNLKTSLTNSIAATETNLINRADQLAQNVTDITDQLTQDKATFTQEIQDALDLLKDEASVASALRTPRKINGVAFDGTGDINLDVYSKSEVDTAIANATQTTPDATETTAGKAKIATTAIAQAGVDDTDIITAKKLRDALNVSGNAPISACRAWICFNGKASPPEILSSLNISSVVKNATGDYTLNFTTPLENSNYAVSCSGVTGAAGNKFYPCVKAVGFGGVPALKTPTQLGIACIATSTSTSLVDIPEIYIEVFC